MKYIVSNVIYKNISGNSINPNLIGAAGFSVTHRAGMDTKEQSCCIGGTLIRNKSEGTISPQSVAHRFR